MHSTHCWYEHREQKKTTSISYSYIFSTSETDSNTEVQNAKTRMNFQVTYFYHEVMFVNNEFSGHIVYREVTFVNILIFLEKDEGQKKLVSWRFLAASL